MTYVFCQALEKLTQFFKNTSKEVLIQSHIQILLLLLEPPLSATQFRSFSSPPIITEAGPI